MAHLITSDAKFKVAGVANLSTSGGWTPVEVDGSGFDRACFVVQRGTQTGATKNTLRTSLYHSATTGGTFTLASGTLGTMANTTSNKAYQLEFAITAAKPFLKLYGTGGGTGTATMVCAAVAVLYRGSRVLPPTQDVTVALA